MVDAWSGDMLLADDTVVADIHFASQHASTPAITSAPLRFLATVDTARIPRYLAAGPSYDVWTSNTETEQWFASYLLSQPSSSEEKIQKGAGRGWWTLPRAQSPVGILVKAQDEFAGARGPRITEILFYGTIAVAAQGALPTPPSSSPEPQSTHLVELKVHALPLSSDLVYQTASIPTSWPSSSITKPEINTDVESRFLPPLHAAELLPNSPKRKRDVFEEATQARRKARGKGGEEVAAAAAKTQDSQRVMGHQRSLSLNKQMTYQSDSNLNILGRDKLGSTSRPLSRSSSIASDTRPQSRRETQDGPSKRSTLSRVATISLQPEEPTIQTRNKEALSRVVLAAMRMHGLQQRKKARSRRPSIAPGPDVMEESAAEIAMEDASRDEEYKQIYHQTYKGAILALRKHISTNPLHSQPDQLRDVVERLLSIFCVDPLTIPLVDESSHSLLATPRAGSALATPGTAQGDVNPFDLPSGTRAKVPNSVDESQGHDRSPICRRTRAIPPGAG